MVLLLISGGALGATIITQCGNLNSSVDYVLGNDIWNAGNHEVASCINITSSNVVFDGANHYIIGNSAAPGTYGIYINNQTSSVTNVTVKNLTVTKWDYGIYVMNSSNNIIIKNNVSNNNKGIFINNSFNSTIYNNYFNNTCVDNNAIGICDTPFIIDANNTDFLPLSTKLPGVRYINGTVRDNVSKAGIQGARVFTNTNNSTVTNASGFYSLNVSAGIYNLTAVSDPAYYTNNSVTVSTEFSAVVLQDIELMRKPTGNITGRVTNAQG